MFDILFTKIGGVPVFYIVPILFFGPILFYVMKQIGIHTVFSIPSEMRAKWARERAEKEQLTAERRKKMGDSEKVVRPMPKRNVFQWAGQALVYAVIAAPIAYCSSNPEFQLHDPNDAQLKLSLSIPGDHKVECKKLSREELMKLPPQKRGKADCGRERWPVYMEVMVDDQTVFKGTKNPGGLSSDSASLFYEKFMVPSGNHILKVNMRTSGRESGFDRTLEREIALVPKEILVIGFNMENNDIILRHR